MILKEYYDSFSTREITIGKIALTLDGWSARTEDCDHDQPGKCETRTQITVTFTGDEALKARAILDALIHETNAESIHRHPNHEKQ